MVDVRYTLPGSVIAAVKALGIDESQIDSMKMEREGALVVYSLTFRDHRVRELVIDVDGELATIEVRL